MLRFENVSLTVDNRVLLAPTSFAIATGARLAVVGTSGAGKSTILRLALGLALPTAGEVHVLGEPLTPASCERLRLRMGYVVQEGGLFPHLKAGDGAALVAMDLGWSASRRRDRLVELGLLVGVAPDLFDRYPFQLSGGQRQRMGLVRALMLDPELLLFDEPFAALDPVSSARLEDDLLGIINTLGRTLIMVTHDLARAGRIGHDIAVMHEGRVLQRGTYATLAREPAHPFVTELLQAQRSAPRQTGVS
jgi:osmoprotectant transport system ATP-binding protein